MSPFIPYVLRFTHEIKPATNQSEKRSTVKIHRSSNQRHERWYFTMEGNERAAFGKNKMEEEVPRFALREETIDDLIDKEENKNTRLTET